MEASLLMPKKRVQEFSPKIWWKWHRKGLWRPGFITGAIIHSVVVAVREMVSKPPKSVLQSQKCFNFWVWRQPLRSLFLCVGRKRNIWSCHKGTVFLFFDRTVEIFKSRSTFLLFFKVNKRKDVDGKQWLVSSSFMSSVFICSLSPSLSTFSIGSARLIWVWNFLEYYFTSSWIFTTHWPEDGTLQWN